MSAVWRSLRQTLLAVLGDRYAIVVMVGAVILYSFFYPAAYRHQVAGNLPVLVVDQDHSATSRELLRILDGLRVARVVGQPADLDSARRQLETGHAEGIVLIPANLERDILRGQPAKLVLLGNGAYLGRASWVLGSIADALGTFGRDAAVTQAAFMGAPQAAPVTLVQRPLYNTQEGYGSAIVPGVAELIVHQTLLMGIGVLLGRDADSRSSRCQPYAGAIGVDQQGHAGGRRYLHFGKSGVVRTTLSGCNARPRSRTAR